MHMVHTGNWPCAGGLPLKHGPMRESCDKNTPFAIYVRPDCPRVGPDRLPRVRTGPVPVGRPRPEHAARVLFPEQRLCI